MVLTPGMCAGVKAGGRAHRLENRSAEPVVFLEIGDRAAGDTVVYGDAGRRESLIAAGIHRAALVVITYANTPSAVKVPRVTGVECRTRVTFSKALKPL